jgi:hypothetical protein
VTTTSRVDENDIETFCMGEFDGMGSNVSGIFPISTFK